MNTNDFSDEQVLERVNQHLQGVESMIPWPAVRHWGAERGSESRVSGRTRVRAGLGVGRVASAVLLVICLALAAGPLALLGSRDGDAQASLTPYTTEVAYRVSAANGSVPTAAQLRNVLEIERARADRYVKPYGVPVSVTALEPDRIVVVMSSIQASRPAAAAGEASSEYYDPAVLRRILVDVGDVQVVPLPVARFGTQSVPGPEAVPMDGSRIDATLPALMTKAQLVDGSPRYVVQPVAGQNPGDSAPAPTFNPYIGTYTFDLDSTSAATWRTWAAVHAAERVALVLDGSVLAVFTVSEPGDGKRLAVGGLLLADLQRLDSTVHSEQLPLALVQVSDRTIGGPDYTGPLPTSVPDKTPWSVPAGVVASGRTLGSESAPVTIDVWVDFRMVPCALSANGLVRPVIDDYIPAGKVKVVLHGLTVTDSLDGSQDSRNAAAAARIAGDQGKFWEYAFLLCSNQHDVPNGAFKRDGLISLAQTAGLDVNRFTADLDAGKYLSEVSTESAAGQAAGMGPQSVVVNGKQVSGTDYAAVAAAIDAALASAPTTP